MSVRPPPFLGMMLTVLTGPLCGMCAVMKGWLAELGVSYREVDVTTNAAARRLLVGLAHGYISVPTLVFVDGAALVEPRRDALENALRARRLIR